MPFHALSRLVGGSGNLVERLVQRQIVPDRILPTSRVLVAIIGITTHNKVIDAVEIELAVRRIEDSLRDHLRIAILGLNVLVIVKTKVYAAGSKDSSGSARCDRGLCNRRSVAIVR